MQEFDNARQPQYRSISIASDYVGTLAGNPELTNLLATQVKANNEVSILSSAPPTGPLLQIFIMTTEATLTQELTKEEFETLTSFTKKPKVPEKHYNIVFDDEEVNWCTYDYHIKAGTPAFERFLDEHANNPYKNLMDIAKELSCVFMGNGIKTTTATENSPIRKEL